jgi:hypothetical protein
LDVDMTVTEEAVELLVMVSWSFTCCDFFFIVLRNRLNTFMFICIRIKKQRGKRVLLSNKCQ